MKRFPVRKALGKATGAAVAASLLVGAAPQAVQAHYVEKVEGDWAYVRYTFKGAEGQLFRVRRNKAARYATKAGANSRSQERREAVAGFRVETDAQGRQWVIKPRLFKGAVAGWMRVPVQETNQKEAK